ncbi:1-pyrroline-5-carboxylate dehydrogenase [Vallitalea longa]|uniref:1-pyrroline-5-carboxylate dehydrogenase n=1 Tax=Vallitalea longa TaxID=2936439 RepID=A0A9W5YFV2_9FIRM|nr:bifunctional oligoribonuclease/PAP phosphatase NrnA [Vallitalea longa]GKX31745.1 1-pyrroline-5-carboxylate dehydrogenase [Vallitalea longa]
MNLQEIINICGDKKNIIISGHIHPDGDCVGACYALASILHKKGIDVEIALDDVPDTYDYLVGSNYLLKTIKKDIDIFISLDCGDKERLGSNSKLFDEAAVTVNIDHHISNTQFADYNYVSDVSSTCEIIYEILDGSDDTDLLDKDICEALYTGLIYDTGAFKHSNTTRRTHQIAGDIISYGIDFTDITNRLFYYKSYKSLQILGTAIKNTERHINDKLILTTLSTEELEEYDCNKKDTESIVQILNEVTESECAIFIMQVSSDEYKISLRSRNNVDVCAIAREFGGGGHIKASGCTISGNLTSIKERLINVVKRQIEERA